MRRLICALVGHRPVQRHYLNVDWTFTNRTYTECGRCGHPLPDG